MTSMTDKVLKSQALFDNESIQHYVLNLQNSVTFIEAFGQLHTYYK